MFEFVIANVTIQSNNGKMLNLLLSMISQWDELYFTTFHLRALQGNLKKIDNISFYHYLTIVGMPSGPNDNHPPHKALIIPIGVIPQDTQDHTRRCHAPRLRSRSCHSKVFHSHAPLFY